MQIFFQGLAGTEIRNFCWGTCPRLLGLGGGGGSPPIRNLAPSAPSLGFSRPKFCPQPPN